MTLSGVGGRCAPSRVAIVSSVVIVVGLIVVVAVVFGVSLYLSDLAPGPGSSSTPSSSSTSAQGAQGVVVGYVTVGPSQPGCSPGQSCTEALSGYSLIFTSECPSASVSASSSSCSPQSYEAQIAPSGHYSILLAPGPYSISGLAPSCTWSGCSSAFPELVTVEPGQQIVVNVNVDTGIT